jgi:hypothetical protein
MSSALHPLVALADAGIAEALFDLVPDVVFFVKDGVGRYTAVNHTLVARCGCKSKAEIIGKTVRAFFPTELADVYAIQDRRVLNTGRRSWRNSSCSGYRRRGGGCARRMLGWQRTRWLAAFMITALLPGSSKQRRA